tara:strand:- start:20693 stop:21823 length:1131 start_codon:yes stop_codon:yes gene_type:complete
MANGISGSDVRRGVAAFLTGTPRSELERRDVEAERQGISNFNDKDTAALSSIAQGATQLKQIQDPQEKLKFLRQRKDQLDTAGIDSSDTVQAMNMINAGDFEGLEQLTDQAIQLGQRLRSSGGGIKSFAPVETLNPTTGLREIGIPTLDPNTGLTAFKPVVLPEGTELSKETPEAKRNAELEASINKKRGELTAQQRHSISTEVSSNARTSRRQLPRINKLIEGLELVETGAFANAKLLLGPFIPGVDPTKEEAFSAQLNDLILDSLGKLSGPISDSDLAFIRTTTASMGKTKEANKLILNRLKQNLNDSIDEESQFKEFKQGGGKAEDFEFKAVRAPQPLFSQTLGREITDQDIDDTAKARGLTRDEVIEKLGVR